MTGIDALVDALRLTVPAHIAELRAREVPPWLTGEDMLTALTARAATEFATRGDALQFNPRANNHLRSARQAGLGLSQAVAAAALLNPHTGVEVFGAHFCAGVHEGCPLLPSVSGPGFGEVHALLDEYEALLGLGPESSREAA